MSLMGLDVGTTGCKAVAFDLEGRVLTQAYREYPLLYPQPGWAELDAHGIWRCVSEVIAETNAQLKDDPVKALSISSQGEAVAAVDKDGELLCDFSVSFDSRTAPQAQWWHRQWGPLRLFEYTGMPLHSMYTINKLMWYKENQPQVYRLAAKFLCVEDFVNFKLTGEYAIDWSLAARTMAFDVKKKDWSDDILAAADIDKNLWSPAYPSGKAFGTIKSDVTHKLGFQNGVIVAAGGHDQPCGALGAGITEPGIAMNALGTSDVICPVFANLLLSEEMLAANYSCYPHVDTQQYVSIAFNLTGGLLLRWYRDTFCESQVTRARETHTNEYEIIIDQASSDARNIFFLPHFVGAGTPYLNSNSRGALVGLTVDTTKADITKALLDSLNYEMKVNIDLMNKVGMGISELRAIGGGSKSRKWLQMKADTFNMPISSLEVSEAASLGAAILAGLSIGVFKDPGTAVKAMVRIKDTYIPDKAQHELYMQRYENYKQLYNTILPFNDLISNNTMS